MKEKVVVISKEKDRVEFGTLEQGVFMPECGYARFGLDVSGVGIPKYEERIIELGDNAKPAEESSEEISCMAQQRNRRRARQCRKARGERISLEINWPLAIIGIWLYTLPFLMLLAGALLERLGL